MSRRLLILTLFVTFIVPLAGASARQGNYVSPPLPYQDSPYRDTATPTLNITIVDDGLAGTQYSQFEVLKNGQSVATSDWGRGQESWTISPSLAPGEYTWHARVSIGDNIGPSFETAYSQTSDWSMELPLIVDGETEDTAQANYPICNAQSTGNTAVNRGLILIQGFTSQAVDINDIADEWQFLIPEQTQQLYSHIIYFSYDLFGRDSYTEEDTYAGIWEHHVPLLTGLIQNCHDVNGIQYFDIIGHSMGGLVAFEYIKQNGLSGPQTGWVQNVITLDSPVNGSSWAAYGVGADLEGKIDLLLGEGAGSSQASFDMALIRNSDPYQRNSDFTRALTAIEIQVITFTNADDLFVPTYDAVISGYGYIYHLGNLDTKSPSKFLGHDQIFSDAEVTHDIFSSLFH